MFLSMAAMALTTYALLVLHSPLPTLSTPLAVEVCSEEARAQVWSSLPECRPRPPLITLPLPRDPSILQVIHLLFEIHIPDHPNPTLTPRPVPGHPQPSRGGAMRGHLPLARRGPVPALCCRPHQKYKVRGTFAVSGPTEHCPIFHFPSVLLRHRRDILTFLDILTVYTMKTIYFLNAYHLGW